MVVYPMKHKVGIKIALDVIIHSEVWTKIQQLVCVEKFMDLWGNWCTRPLNKTYHRHKKGRYIVPLPVEMMPKTSL